MHYYHGTFAVVGMTMASLIAIAGCDSGDGASASFRASQLAASNPVADSTVNACDGIRHHIRREALKQFGFDIMVEQMKRISREISSDEREDLRRHLQAISTPGINPELQAQSMRLIEGIYNGAVDRSGIHRGQGESRDEIHRFITACPSDTTPLFDGFVPVLSSSATEKTQPTVGAITDAYLAVSADQSHYEALFLRVKTVTPGPNNGYHSVDEFITMSQYIATKLPSYCANVGSVLPQTQLNLVE